MLPGICVLKDIFLSVNRKYIIENIKIKEKNPMKNTKKCDVIIDGSIVNKRRKITVKTIKTAVICYIVSP